DLTLLATPAEIAPASAGRVLFRADGSPLAIVELSDIQTRTCRADLRRFLTTTREDRVARDRIEEILTRHLGKSASLDRVLREGSMGGGTADTIDRNSIVQSMEGLAEDFRFGPNGQAIPPDEALHARYRNESVYLVRKGALRYGLNHMSTDNAQH